MASNYPLHGVTGTEFKFHILFWENASPNGRKQVDFLLPLHFPALKPLLQLLLGLLALLSCRIHVGTLL